MPDSELFKGVESRSQVGYVNVNRFWTRESPIPVPEKLFELKRRNPNGGELAATFLSRVDT